MTASTPEIPKRSCPPTPLERAVSRLELLLGAFEANNARLWRTLQRIAEAPHRVLLIENPLVDAGEAQAITPERFMETLLEPEAVTFTHRKPHFCKGGRRWRFLKVFDERTRLSEATLPNQVTAFLIREVTRHLKASTLVLQGNRGGERERRLIEDAQRLRMRLLSVLQRSDALQFAPKLRQFPTNNLVLNHHPLYSQIMSACVQLVVGNRSRR